jgi:hypothetical protein
MIPQCNSITVPIKEFLTERMKLDSNFLAAYIAKDDYLLIVIDLIRKADTGHVINDGERAELNLFSQSLRLKNMKIRKGHIAEQNYLYQAKIKMNFWKMLRQTWTYSGIFDKTNPREMDVKYKQYNHETCLTAISQMISKACFNDSSPYGIQFLSSPGKILFFIIHMSKF